MTDQYCEYAVDEKPSGKNLLLRVLLICGYILFSLVFFIICYRVGIVQLIAALPLLLLVIILFTWQYVSVTHEYIIEVGEISFVHIYANRRRREVLRLPVREALAIAPCEGKKPQADQVYEFRSTKDSPDSYYFLFVNEREQRCVAYFEATRKALKLMQIYNPGAVKMGKTRY